MVKSAIVILVAISFAGVVQGQELNPSHLDSDMVQENVIDSLVKRSYYQSVHPPHGIELEFLQALQEECLFNFNQALNYANKAHEIDPDNKEVILLMSNIYLALNDIENHKRYQAMYNAQ